MNCAYHSAVCKGNEKQREKWMENLINPFEQWKIASEVSVIKIIIINTVFMERCESVALIDVIFIVSVGDVRVLLFFPTSFWFFFVVR